MIGTCFDPAFLGTSPLGKEERAFPIKTPAANWALLARTVLTQLLLGHQQAFLCKNSFCEPRKLEEIQPFPLSECPRLSFHQYTNRNSLFSLIPITVLFLVALPAFFKRGLCLRIPLWTRGWRGVINRKIKAIPKHRQGMGRLVWGSRSCGG